MFLIMEVRYSMDESFAFEELHKFIIKKNISRVFIPSAKRIYVHKRNNVEMFHPHIFII